MRRLNYERILTGTALAMVLALPSGVLAEIPNPIDAAVPMPEAAALPPPTAADLGGGSAGTTGTVSPAAPSAQPAAAPAEATPAPAPADTAVGTPAEAPPPDPFAALDPADRPIAEKMRDLLAAKVDKIFANKKEHAAVESFYQNRTLAPLWLDKGVMNSRAKDVIARLKAADADGLDPKDYKIPDLSAASPDALAEAELRLTATVITYARHLQAGRFPFQRISSANIELPQQPPDTAVVLTKLADTDNVGKTLDEFAPPHAQYKALKAMLAELRGKTTEEEDTFVRIPDGQTLRPGMNDPRVPLLRKRFNLAGDENDLRYDDALAKAVKAFQKGADLNADGMIGPSTLRRINAHNAPPRRAEMIDKIIANMERWRWYPRNLGKAYVMVNLPEFRLRVIKNGSMIWDTRIVIGLPSKQTPLTSAEMKYITVNPTWNVPPSIINNEYLPALQQDPTVLDRMGLKLIHNRDGSVHIYQPPGDGNALGRLRFNFPNRFLVYQHDTPDKHLFARDERAYSHGCMRVQDPPKYAEVLLGIARPNETWTAERIKRMYGSSEQDIQFQNLIPVHLTYQTATVEGGKLVIRRDVYGYDAKLIGAIRNDRGMVEMAQDRPREREGGGSVKRARLPQQPHTTSFFEALFGGGAPAARPVPQRRVR